VVFVTQLHQLGSRIGSARAASPSSTALSLSQNRASRVSRATILSHAGRLPMHRSTAIALQAPVANSAIDQRHGSQSGALALPSTG